MWLLRVNCYQYFRLTLRWHLCAEDRDNLIFDRPTHSLVFSCLSISLRVLLLASLIGFVLNLLYYFSNFAHHLYIFFFNIFCFVLPTILFYTNTKLLLCNLPSCYPNTFWQLLLLHPPVRVFCCRIMLCLLRFVLSSHPITTTGEVTGLVVHSRSFS